ncbi:pyruvate,water dikinase [Paenibacillus turicensis]|uniref:Pyruvate,water dikinase n=1 Tax=Paenibacillus turicensis TaxID=160487 RepID=A0ABS4FTP7_9BACL|nr:PEP/pyruvate-binding domain-containing protein [Paenibacillus turicensis]MBP1905951.1 pyruvate,water dikinase [Paenibacillus turicensis]
MKYIKMLQDISKGDISSVGGKGANLGEMLKASFPVPNGFCLTVNAFDLFMKHNSLDHLKLRGDELQAKIISGQLPPELEQEIAQCYASLGQKKRVAVRSSATAEDLPEASFAGQQETYLNVLGETELFIAIKKCFASLYSIRAVSYRKQTNFDTANVLLAVVIQEMVESEVSGVLFTADPINQNRDQMMLNAAWGLGEAIVSGKVTPDIYIYNKRKHRLSSKTLGKKELLIVYGKSGIQEITTTTEQKKQFCLTQKQANELFELGLKIEKYYGFPQDIEWAICKDTLYILQSRPITTLNSTKPQPSILTKSQMAVLNNWIEHFPTPLYPLDVEPCDIVDKAKSKVLQDLGISIDGGLRMNDEGIISFSTDRVHLRFKIVKIPFLLHSFINYNINSSITNNEFQNITNELESIASTDITQLSITALVEQLQHIMMLSEKIAYIRFRYNIFPSVVVSKLLQRTLHKIDKNLNEYDLLSNLQYKTWEMNAALSKLTSYIQDNAELEAFITNQEVIENEHITAIQISYPSFWVQLQQFLHEFGWKSNGSYYAFSSVSWNEDITSLFSLTKIVMQSDKYVSSNNKYNEIVSMIEKRYSTKKSAKLLKKIETIRAYHIHREQSLYLIEMCYGLARKMVFRLTTLLPHIFEQPNHILFLTLAEVYALPSNIHNENKSNNINNSQNNNYVHKIKQTIQLRKTNRPQNETLWNSLSYCRKLEDENTLTGISGNRGITQGQVKKILSIQQFDKMQQGDILVCRYTDPSWTPLFVLAGAVVSDTGGPLSHSAIVAREYNIPAVLGCGNATELLQDGDKIIVDGDTGKVHKI